MGASGLTVGNAQGVYRLSSVQAKESGGRGRGAEVPEQ